MSNYKPETVNAFKELYRDKKDTIDYMIKFGSNIDKAQAILIKEIALAGKSDPQKFLYSQKKENNSQILGGIALNKGVLNDP